MLRSPSEGLTAFKNLPDKSTACNPRLARARNSWEESDMPEDQHPLLTTKTFGLVGLASLACAGIGFMIASPNVFWGGAIVAAFAAGGIVWLASSDYRVAYAKIFRQKKWPSLQEAFELLLPAGILIVLAILVAPQITVASHSKPQTSSVVTIAKLPPYSGNSLDNTILLDCEWVVYPTVIPQNGLYDMELIADSPMLGAVVGPSAFPPGSPIKKTRSKRWSRLYIQMPIFELWRQTAIKGGG